MPARAPLGHLVAEAGGDDGDLDLVAHALVKNGAEDNVGVFMSRTLNERGRRPLTSEKLEGAGAGDVDEDAACSRQWRQLPAAERPWRPCAAFNGAIGTGS